MVNTRKRCVSLTHNCTLFPEGWPAGNLGAAGCSLDSFIAFRTRLCPLRASLANNPCNSQ